MELSVRLTVRGAFATLLAMAALSGALAPAAQAAVPLRIPSSESKPPRFFHRSAREVTRIADRAQKVRSERRSRHRRLRSTAYTRGFGRWQVSYFVGKKEIAQVRVDDRSGRIREQWTGPQVAWTMARGYEGAFGRKLNSPYVWLPLCALFLVPFVDPRRPLRLIHLDLVVLLAFGVSHVFFNRGEIGTSVPLVYPLLLYLLVRMLVAGLRGRERRQRLVPLVPATWLAVALVFLVGFRVGLNVVDSNVIDVGYSGVIGADRIVDGDSLYGPGFASDNAHGNTYGPASYVAYVPFEQVLPWSGSWDDLPAAHGAAIAFDLLTMGGLLLLGRRLRAGPEGRLLGLGLAYAWATYPYAMFALQTNSNDSLVAVTVVGAMLALTADPVRRPLAAAGRGLVVGLGAAAKFAPLALAPLFAAGTGPAPRRERAAAIALAVTVATFVLAFAPFAFDVGVRELYDRTIGYQVGRPSPFSIWGQEPSLGWLQTVVKGAAVLLALAVAFVPRRRDAVQAAALGAAVMLMVELSATHWFYLYIVWFAPLALVAMMAPLRSAGGEEHLLDGGGSAVDAGVDEHAVQPRVVV